MTESSPASSSASDTRSRELAPVAGIDVAPYLRALWSGRWIVASVTLLSAIVGITYGLRATQWYQADVVLIQSENAGSSATLSQLGGLASLAGIALGNPGSDKAPLAVLRSLSLVREFIESENLLPTIMSEHWDPATNSWRNRNPKAQPEIRDAVARFHKKIRSVTEDKSSGLVVLSITWKNPGQAAEWANLLVERANDRLRRQAIEEAEANIVYLRKQAETTAIAALQQSISNVLESEMQKLMLARGSSEFAFKIIDRAVPPKQRVRPQRAVIAITSCIFGFLLSFLAVLVWQGARGSAASRSK